MVEESRRDLGKRHVSNAILGPRWRVVVESGGEREVWQVNAHTEEEAVAKVHRGTHLRVDVVHSVELIR